MQAPQQQTQALTDNRGQPHGSHADTELARARAELTELKARSSEHEREAAKLRQQLDHEKAEVLLLKEGQGGSNRAADVIHALEGQVGPSASCSSPVSLRAHVAVLCPTFFSQAHLQETVKQPAFMIM